MTVVAFELGCCRYNVIVFHAGTLMVAYLLKGWRQRRGSIITRCRDLYFYILVTVRLGMIPVNNQLDAQFPLYMFISILYMFRAALCSSSGDSTVSIQHVVYVSLCGWPSGVQVGKTCTPDGHLHTVKYTRCFINTFDPADDEHKAARNM